MADASKKSLAEQYPECEKLAKVSKRSNACGEFLSWLEAEKGFLLASYNDNERLLPVNYNIEALLGEFFEIDMKKVEKERRAILKSMQS